MTPKEKALELMSKMDVKYNLPIITNTIPVSMHKDQIKQCALIAVDEIIEVACDISFYDESVTKSYWKKVKRQIQKL